jgi:hypothetical protein
MRMYEIRNISTGLTLKTCVALHELLMDRGRSNRQWKLVGWEMVRIPHCLDSRLTDDGKLDNLTHQPRSAPQKN